MTSFEQGGFDQNRQLRSNKAASIKQDDFDQNRQLRSNKMTSFEHDDFDQCSSFAHHFERF
jgi:hypothetical protein